MRMFNTPTKSEQILQILSEKYQVELHKDDELSFSDETNLCITIKNEYNIDDLTEIVKQLNVKPIKYGNIIIFNLN